MINSLFNRIKARLLRRRVTFRYSWRFINAKGFVATHRKVMFVSFTQKPQLILFFVYHLMTWFFFWHWFLMFRAMRLFCQSTLVLGVPLYKQVIGLLRAGLGQGISGFEYYNFKLYQQSTSKWWEYVFDFQLPHFHTTFQVPAISKSSTQFMSNKLVFSERLKSVNGKCIPTISCVNLDDEWPISDWLKQYPSVFIKPIAGSRSMGCVSILLEPRLTYRYLGNDYHSEDELLTLKSSLPKGQYIVQPFLINHSSLQKLQCSSNAITIRAISCSDTNEIKLVMANLELSNEANQRFSLFTINIENGRVALDDTFLSSLACQLPPELTLPHWHKLISAIKQAHGLCPDIHTVGWDVVIGQDDVMLLEGNTNWALNAMQMTCPEPLLGFLSRVSARYTQ